MYTSSLRKVGGSVMLAVPPAILDMLQLSVDSKVNLMVVDGLLKVSLESPKKYTLEELLAKCDANAPLNQDNMVWVNDDPVGEEIL